MRRPDLEDLKQFVTVHPFPTDILVEVITQCNLKCIMCPQQSLTRAKGKMSMELWKKIVKEVAEKSPETRIWPALMGEPLLLGRELFHMIKFAKDIGVKEIHLNSNLTIFKKELIDDLFESRIDELIVGLDGATAETYEKIRRGTHFEKVRENIHYILDEREKRKLPYPQVTLQYIVMDENEHEEEAFVEYWSRVGKKVNLKIKPRTGWSDAVRPWSGIINVSQKDRFLPCTWLLRQMTIFWNGLVPQCDGDWNGETNFGDANTSSLEAIWLGELKKIRDRHMKLDFNFPPCNKCEDWQAGRSRWVKCG